jgi:hypothetical protein
MKQPYVTAVLLIGVMLAGALFAAGVTRQHWPDNHQGYAPVQPIAYSHRLHVDELQMDCRYCHSTAMESRHAGIPSGDVCMRCHKYVTASFNVMQAELNLADKEKRKPNRVVSSELQKLYDAMALDEEMNLREDTQPQAIRWVRVHNLPDFVYFDHRAHVAAGVSCQHCHGPVESMQQVEQFSSLSMGWCVNCHRDAAEHGVQGQPANPSLDCAACHY